MNIFAGILQQLRKDKNLTQKELSDKTGISIVSLSKYETGLLLPGYNNLFKICKALDWDYDEACCVLSSEKRKLK